ncbi:MAG: DUF1573 domain-containing protein [Chitinispirillales bacterium]|jgi:hypothetical protein|nr:DUF1573 domain-containing protein [Chitinispirillales bacterium]
MTPISKTFSALLIAAGAAAVFAAPEIKVEKMTYDGGKVAAGSILKANFKLTNTGNETLKISSVRPGCGCTVVSFDSVIAPGKSGFIKPEVNLKGFSPGQNSRGVTVNSNAANTPALHLTIEFNVAAPPEAIAVSDNYLDFESAAKRTLLLSSAKKDLKVSEVVFIPQDGQNVPGWAANAPQKVKFSFAPTNDTQRDDGLKTYKLDINTPGTGKESVLGNFEITTNHPEKKDISIGGRVR